MAPLLVRLVFTDNTGFRELLAEAAAALVAAYGRMLLLLR